MHSIPYSFELELRHVDGQAQQSRIEDHFITNQMTKEQLSISKGRDQYGYDFMEVKRTKIEKKKKSE